MGVVASMEYRVPSGARNVPVVMTFLADRLEDFAAAVPGFFLYFPSRAQVSPALRAFVVQHPGS